MAAELRRSPILARGGACTPFSSPIYHAVTFRCRFTGFSTGGGVGVRTTVYRRRWWSLRRTGTPLSFAI
ncbi:hypothetical protein HanRHA438_Chr03g0110821 [Helianthus annuus]|uniref:Uncharacterized protein n=1 Tax=Helianthus annuus TaxID=4232 RepID=A0A251VBJ4_HELAN|nr:hypothetical protein HanXRQr2_Chr03g0099781 [Helianthus annuus]KAJ0592275.1 hypothetical protein HanHA300_Chr03g0083081 [Helianthus annuus]KAJ0599781.1 hypothetical protein HanIR_Chr03g0108911 [Helianthus annuus]KAJ0607261.1 hypothetical protein HanHA89_Chr03g0094581 [Helianthus annuus]KAJ0767321.1 hypothetical protein HanLR1_Chr03g0087881 [Helianthus annuus]